MPKARPPFDQARYAQLRAEGLSLRATAKMMGLPDRTLRETLQTLGLHTPAGQMRGTAGTPQGASAGEPGGVAGVPPALLADLEAMLTWWRARQAPQGTPPVKRARATYHLDPALIAAVQQEAQEDGVLIAEVVERALRAYFQGKL